MPFKNEGKRKTSSNIQKTKNLPQYTFTRENSSRRKGFLMEGQVNRKE